jgi:hypothetical protein
MVCKKLSPSGATVFYLPQSIYTQQLYKMKKIILLPIIAILFFASSSSQSVGINNDGSAPNPRAMLDVKHPNKGTVSPQFLQQLKAVIKQSLKPILLWIIE